MNQNSYMGQGIPAGWYPDTVPGQLRWWDGSQWTPQVARGARRTPQTRPDRRPGSVLIAWGVVMCSVGAAVNLLTSILLGLFLVAIVMTAAPIGESAMRIIRTWGGNASLGMIGAGVVLIIWGCVKRSRMNRRAW